MRFNAFYNRRQHGRAEAPAPQRRFPSAVHFKEDGLQYLGALLVGEFISRMVEWCPSRSTAATVMAGSTKTSFHWESGVLAGGSPGSCARIARR